MSPPRSLLMTEPDTDSELKDSRKRQQLESLEDKARFMRGKGIG